MVSFNCDRDPDVVDTWLKDLEKVTESEYLPQKRSLSFLFNNKKLPKIPENDTERKFIPPHRFKPLDFCFFAWIMPLISVGYRRTVQPNDLYKINEEQKVENLHKRFSKHWNKILIKRKQKPRKIDLILTCLQTFKWEYSMAVVYVVISNCSLCLMPLFSKRLIAAVEERIKDKSLSPGKGIGYAFGCAMMLLVFALAYAHSYYNSFVVGGLVRSVLQRSLLIKTFKLSNSSKKKFSQAVISSMSTTDLNRIELGISNHPMLYAFPPSLAIVIVQLIVNVGPISLIGCLYFGLSTFIGAYGFSYAYKYRYKANFFTDIRIGLVREIANSLKIIKFFCWEKAYMNKLKFLRKKETHELKKFQFFIALYVGIGVVTPLASPFLVFASYYGIHKTLSSAANLFSSLSLFSSLTAFMFMLPEIFSQGITAFVAFKRVQEFLLLEEVTDTENDDVTIPCESNDNSIEVENCSFKWQDSIGDDGNIVKSSFSGLQNVNFNVKKGEFVMITGAIGTGKSSLLQALAGLMEMTDGELRVNGKLLLNGQPWIQNTTLKNNILFGSTYDSKKYIEVLNACCLTGDIKLMRAGDNTEIGEKGVTLSGGQKQRLALARTCYRESDIYLLDDVLSAVDANVGKNIMDNCLLKLLSGKTRIMATHQLNLITFADKILFLDNSGEISFGKYDDLLKLNKNFKSLVETFNSNSEEDDLSELMSAEMCSDDEKDFKEDATSIQPGRSLSKNKYDQCSISSNEYDEDSKKDEGRLTEKENRAVNSLSLHVYKTYLELGSKMWKLILSIFTFNCTLSQFCYVFVGIWLTYWSEYKFKEYSNGFYIGIYALLIAMIFILISAETYTAFLFNISSSKNMHNEAARGILHVPMSYIDKTPVGTIINRFTKDIDVLDNDMPTALDIVTYSFASMIAIAILTMIYLPWYAIAVPFLALMFYLIRDVYQTTGREVKRLESIQRSFVVNNFQEAISGIDTISMFGMQDMFIFKNDFTCNKQNEATMAYQGLQRWASIWIMLLVVIATLIITILCAAGVFSMSAANTGLLINYVIEFASVIRMLLIFSTELENYMNSAERLCHYATDLEVEGKYEFNDPGADWPRKPFIEFNNVCMRYRDNLPLVLKNLSFRVNAGEKIGICGKTGCGKSSTINCIFRINEIESGSITIDNVDISQIGLYNLRSRLGIIPQESVLFQTTIRGNLDPFNEHTDDDLWNALVDSGAIEKDELEKVKLQEFPKEQETGHRFHLYREVEEDGNNFSLGEKQLLGLSRAVVKRSNILVLDEATSAVDYETDAKIQTKIRENFGKDTTIITIAHRIKTIIDYDKILVLDEGRVKEFDDPYTLYKTEGSIFQKLCKKANIRDIDFHN